MPTYIIITRNPSNRKLLVVEETDGSIAEFQTEEKAMERAIDVPCCRAWGAEILPLDRP